MTCHRASCYQEIDGVDFKPRDLQLKTEPELTMTIKLSSDGFAVINPDFKLIDAKIYPPPPAGTMLCANINTGKTIISNWSDSYGFTHWAPMPVFPK